MATTKKTPVKAAVKAATKPTHPAIAAKLCSDCGKLDQDYIEWIEKICKMPIANTARREKVCNCPDE